MSDPFDITAAWDRHLAEETEAYYAQPVHRFEVGDEVWFAFRDGERLGKVVGYPTLYFGVEVEYEGQIYGRFEAECRKAED